MLITLSLSRAGSVSPIAPKSDTARCRRLAARRGGGGVRDIPERRSKVSDRDRFKGFVNLHDAAMQGIDEAKVTPF